MSFRVRRLVAADAAIYQQLRLEGLRSHSDCFRIAPEDEEALPLAAVEAKLEAAFVLGGFQDGVLVGIAALSILPGAKARHKGLLWGMYVRAACQGQGLADQLIEGILNEAKRLGLLQVQLTVIAQNPRAYRTYERWGFELYGTERNSVKVGDTYLDEQLRVRWLS